MKTKKNFFKIIILAMSFMYSTSLFAQFSELGNIMSTGKDDAQKILEAYVTPFSVGMGSALSGGWYNTAEPHKLGGFDVTFTANVVVIPSSDKTFNPQKMGLGDSKNGITAVINENESPTFAGKNEAGPQVTYYQDYLGTPDNTGDDLVMTQFKLPKGTNVGYSFMPMVQFGIGLVKGTEINGRYSPTLSYGDNGKLGLWGVGIKHDVKQWIPGLKSVPVLNISVQAGYTKMSSINDLNFQPKFYDDIVVNPSSTTYDDQQLIMDISNTTANLLVSANLPIISLYGGIGMSKTKTNLRMEGAFPFAELNESDEMELVKLNDPVDMEIKNTDLRLNAGVRLKMAVITLHFDYTYANYSIATAGIGVSLR